MITTFNDLIDYNDTRSYTYYSEDNNKEITLDLPIFNVKKVEKMKLEEFEDMIIDLYETIFDNYWINKDIRVIFKINNLEKVYTLSQSLIQLLYFIGNIKYNKKITEDYLFEMESINKTDVQEYCTSVVELLTMDEKNDEKKNEIIQYVFQYIVEKLYIIGKNACYPHAVSFSLYDLGSFAKRNDEFRALIDNRLDENVSIKETENEILRLQKELLKIIEKDKHNESYMLIKSKKLDITQFSQLLVGIGRRTNIDKTILPKMTNTNFLSGLRNVTDFVNESIVGRDAEINKKVLVGKAGYFSRKTDLLCDNLHIDYDMEDCGTSHYSEIEVKSEYHLRTLRGKYMIKDDCSLEEINPKKHRNLIGTRIKFRSHICCINNKYESNGKHYVCKTCFGALSGRLIGTCIGGLPSVKAINPLLDVCMSTKHKTVSKVIDISKSNLSSLFKLESDEVYLKSELNYTGCFLKINKTQLLEIINSDEDIELENVYFIRKDKNNVTVERSQLDEDGITLILSEEIIEDAKAMFKSTVDSEYSYLDLSKYDKSQPVFIMKLMNEDASYYLYKLNRILEGASIRSFKNYSECLEELTDIMYKTDIKTNITNLESIVYKLIRRKDNKLLRPDFTEEIPSYIFCRMSEAIIHSESFYISLSFQELKKLFNDASTYEKRGCSQYDSFFKVDGGRVKYDDENIF